MRFLFVAASVFVPAYMACAQTPPPVNPTPAPKPPAMDNLTAAPRPGAAKEVAPDTVVVAIGDEKITRAQFEQILSTLPEQQKAQLAAPEGKRKLAESLAELKALAQEGHIRKLDQTPKM